MDSCTCARSWVRPKSSTHMLLLCLMIMNAEDFHCSTKSQILCLFLSQATWAEAQGKYKFVLQLPCSNKKVKWSHAWASRQAQTNSTAASAAKLRIVTPPLHCMLTSNKQRQLISNTCPSNHQALRLRVASKWHVEQFPVLSFSVSATCKEILKASGSVELPSALRPPMVLAKWLSPALENICRSQTKLVRSALGGCLWSWNGPFLWMKSIQARVLAANHEPSERLSQRKPLPPHANTCGNYPALWKGIFANWDWECQFKCTDPKSRERRNQ